MKVFIKLLSGDIQTIRVNSEFNSFALGDEVMNSVATNFSVDFRRIVLFRRGDTVKMEDEIDNGEMLEVFIKED